MSRTRGQTTCQTSLLLRFFHVIEFLTNLFQHKRNATRTPVFETLRYRLQMRLLKITLLGVLILAIHSYFGYQIRCTNSLRLVGLNPQEIQQLAIHEAAHTAIAVLILGLIIIGVAALYLKSRVVQPIEQLIETLLRHSSRGEKHDLQFQSKDELGRLAETLNHLLESKEQEQEDLRIQSHIIEQCTIATLLCDSEGRIEWVNKGFKNLFGYSLNECFGRKFTKIITGPETSTNAIELLQQAVDQGQTDTLAGLLYTKSGSAYWCELDLQPVFDQQRCVKGFYCVIYENSKLLQAEQRYEKRLYEMLEIRAQLEQQAIELELRNRELEQAKQLAVKAANAKSEFLANMSHEIRTPMTAILGFNQLLLDHVTEPELIQSSQTIQRNAEYLLDLINDILDYSKIEARGLKIESIPVTPKQLINSTLELLQSRATAKGIQLIQNFDPQVPDQVLSDPTRLRQIILNLLSNAIKFTAQGEVRIETKYLAESQQLQIELHDSGIGMNAAQLQKLFQPFVQADSSTTRRFGGTGLGLSICKNLAELMLGSIRVCSAPNQGSCFTVLITAPRLSTNTHTEAGTDIKAKIDFKQIRLPYRILLAEDGPDNQRLIQHLLKSVGATVTIAENGWIALNNAREAIQHGTPFDCILMDVQMPVMDGYQATAEIRRLGYKGPILALTANALDEDRQRCLNCGCDDYTTKPISRELLYRLIHELISEKQSLTVDELVATEVTDN
jgi:PAS domain S-box-containing protein